MSYDPTTLETDLRQLRPAGLDPSLLDRLDACANRSWSETGPMEIQREKELAAIMPAKLPPALMASLEATLNHVAFPKEKTIVNFPLKTQSPRAQDRNRWAAAAAVALCGAATALLIPAKQSHGHLTTAPGHQQNMPASPKDGELTPAGFNRGLSEASDQGVIWQSGDQPHRVVKVVYKDQVTLKDANGHTYQVEQPRVEYILVPTRTH